MSFIGGAVGRPQGCYYFWGVCLDVDRWALGLILLGEGLSMWAKEAF